MTATDPRRVLLRTDAGTARPADWRAETLDEHRRSACGRGEPLRGEPLISEIDAAGLRGRGGAAFPTARKWRAVAAGRRRPVVVANGEEGEPLSVKDRYLLRRRPHLVLDGLLLAREALGADRAVVYLADDRARISVYGALHERGQSDEVEILQVDHTYVAGEESAVVRALNGGPAMPSAKPPRPFEAGVDGRPTLVQNVETLAQIAWLARAGAPAFRTCGSPRAAGTFLATIVHDTAPPRLLELELGITIRGVLAAAGIEGDAVRGILVGGYFGGILSRRALDTPCDYETLVAAGSGLGCGTFTVLGAGDCPVAAAAGILRYFAHASSGQCGACVRGTDSMAAVVERVCALEDPGEELDRLARWASSLRGRGACALLDGATVTAASLLREFAAEVAAHRRGECPSCAAGRRWTAAQVLDSPKLSYAT